MSEDTTRWFLIELLGIVGGCAVLIWCISFAVRSANKKERGIHPHARPPGSGPLNPPPSRALPVVIDDGPGTFEVSGVDKESGMDVTEYVTASSPANARVKAELKGVVVTKLQRTK
jgi:hypothetical protein